MERVQRARAAAPLPDAQNPQTQGTPWLYRFDLWAVGAALGPGGPAAPSAVGLGQPGAAVPGPALQSM